MLLLACVFLPCGASTPAAGPDAPASFTSGWSDAERYVLNSARAGTWADFNTRCNAARPRIRVVPHDQCRLLHAGTLNNLLTIPELKASIGPEGVRVIGAEIDGDLALANQKITMPVAIVDSALDGALDLGNADLTSSFSFESSTISGDVLFGRSQSTQSLSFGAGDLSGIQSTIGTSVLGKFVASGAHIAGSLLLTRASFGSVLDLSKARIGADLSATDASFAAGAVFSNAEVSGDLDLERAHAARALLLDRTVIKGSLSLADAEIGSTTMSCEFMDHGAVSVCGPRIRIEGGLDLSHGHFSDAIWLKYAWVHDFLKAEYAQFDRGLYASFLQLGSNIEAHDAKIMVSLELYGAQISGNLGLNAASVPQRLYAAYSKIGGNVDLVAASLGQVDLQGSKIGGSLQLGYRRWPGPAWVEFRADPTAAEAEPQLNLFNASVVALEDSSIKEGPGSDHGWPGDVQLDGFTYGRLGTTSVYESRPINRNGEECETDGIGIHLRPVCWWKDRLARTHTFSPFPYVQLSGVLISEGYREEADDILFAEKTRETSRTWESCSYLSWIRLTSLRFVMGYGIGNRIFLVLLYVLGLTVLGMIILIFSSLPRHRAAWYLGASLSRLLPGVEISSEFKDFFDGREFRSSHWAMRTYFGALVILGWIFGVFILAGLAGLTQRPG